MFTFLIGFVLKFLSSGMLNQVLGFLQNQSNNATQLGITQINASTQIAVSHIQAEIAERQGANQIRLATAGYWEMRVMTFLIALPFVIHVNLVGIDTNFKFHWGIYSFPAPFDQWEGAILLSFFGIYSISHVGQSIAAAVMNRK